MAKKATAKKRAAEKATTKKATAKKRAAEKATTKKATAKKRAAEKATTKKATAKKATTKKRAAEKGETKGSQRKAGPGKPKTQSKKETSNASATAAGAKQKAQAQPGREQDAREMPGDERQASGREPKSVPLTSLNTAELLQWFIGVLATKAWQDLGLVADPETGEAGEDLSQAELAIDVAGILAAKVKTSSDKQVNNELETLITNLRLNFVAKSRQD